MADRDQPHGLALQLRLAASNVTPGTISASD